MKESEKEAEKQKLIKKDKQYLSACIKADKVLTKNESSWLVSDFKTVMKPLKREEDSAMPNLKGDLEERWKVWQNRKRRKLNYPEMEEALLESLNFPGGEKSDIKIESTTFGDDKVSVLESTGQMEQM